MKLLPESFWRDGIQFYFDGISFAYKTNPFNDTSPLRPWTGEGHTKGYYAQQEEQKEGNCGRMAYFFVAIVSNKDVILCKQYHGKLTGEGFNEFAGSYFPRTFERSKNPHGKLFLQDGDPCQVSRCAKNAIDDVGYSMFAIPACSPDLKSHKKHVSSGSCKFTKTCPDQINQKRDIFEIFTSRTKDYQKAHQLKSSIKPLALCLRDLQRLWTPRVKLSITNLFLCYIQVCCFYLFVLFLRVCFVSSVCMFCYEALHGICNALFHLHAV